MFMFVGVSQSTIKWMKREQQLLDDEFPTPKRRYKQGRIRVNPDDAEKEDIRQVIYGMYDKKESVTLTKLLVYLYYICMLGK